MKNDALVREANEFVTKSQPFGFVRPQAVAEEFSGKYLMVNGKRVVDLTRLDYISLGSSVEVKEILIQSILRNNLSCPASQIVMKSSHNIMVENVLSQFHGLSSSVVFTSGYTTNVNMAGALGLRMNTPYFLPYRRVSGMGKETSKIPTIFFVDSESHFSLREGMRIAKLQTNKCAINQYESGDYDALEELLVKSKKEDGEAVRIIVTDALSSISGKIFDIERLGKLAAENACWLYVDEAHSIGSIGAGGRGITTNAVCFDDIKDNVFVMGTLTKSVTVLGGYIVMNNSDVRSELRIFSPQYIFSAPMPPWIAEATAGILALVEGTYGQIERSKLGSVSKKLRDSLNYNGFDTFCSDSHIVPVKIGSSEKAHKIRDYFEEKGFLVSVFDYPAVRKDESIVRFSICSDINEEEVEVITRLMIVAREKFLR